MRLIGILFVWILSIATTAVAQEDSTIAQSVGMSKEFETPYGVSMAASMGQSTVTLSPANQGDAIYSGINLMGQLHIPFYESTAYSARLGFSGRYLDLTNNSNSSSQREGGNHLGLGMGLKFTVYRLVFGVDYYRVKARHYWVGDVNDYREFNFPIINWYAGLDFSVSKVFRVSLLYSNGSGTIDRADVALDGDAKYEDTTIWLQFSYGTGDSFTQFLSSLFDAS